MNRKKFLCPKQDETLGALIPFEFADAIKIYNTY